MTKLTTFTMRTLLGWGFALCLSLAFGAIRAQAQQAITTTPELSLSVNRSFAPISSQGWPLIFELEVYHPAVDQRNGNAVPINLNLPTGSWADAVRLMIRDTSGNLQTWPTSLVYRPGGTQGSITLGVGIEGRLAWTVGPSNTTGIAAGNYEAVAILDATPTTAQGAFNGMVASNPVTITVGPEPSPLPASQQEDKYTLLAAYDLLQGNSNQAQADLNTLLQNQPNSIIGMTYMGDLLNLLGQPLQALQSYDQALAAFDAAFPTPPEPPNALIARQATLRAGMISQSGIVGQPQITVSLSGIGFQSPGVMFLEFGLANHGSGSAGLSNITQLSYMTLSGTGQVTYDTTLSPPVPIGINSLDPGTSTTVKIYLDVPATVNQFSMELDGVTLDAVGTSYDFSATNTINPSSVGVASPLIITAVNVAQQYGQATPSLNNLTYAGFVNGDTPASLSGVLTCTTTATAASAVGIYPITCFGLSSPNYIITYLPGTLTVTPAPLTLTANNAMRQYGQGNPSLNNAIFTGLVNGDTPASLAGSLNCTTSATPASPVSGGPYPINCSGLISANYTVTYVPGTLAITPAPLAVAANNASRPYGANNPSFSGMITGLLNSDPVNASFSSSAAPTSPVGAYPIAPTVAGAPAVLSNYNISLVNGTLSVMSETTSLTVTFSPVSISVGQTTTMTLTLTAPDMVIPIPATDLNNQTVLRPITVTSPVVSDILSNNGACTPLPSATIGLASCAITVTSVEPNGRTLNASFAGSSDLAASSSAGNLIVTAALNSQQACIASDFRNVTVPGGSTIWFNSIFKVHDVSKQLFHVTFSQSTVQFQYTDASGNLVNANQALPDAQVTIDPNAVLASTTFDPANNVWITTIPWDLDDNAFLTGMPWLIPSAGLPADVEPVTVCGTFASDVANIDIGWRWAAAAYSSFGSDNNVLGVKPMDTDHDNQAPNHDRAGTPENYKQFVIPGARSKGTKNYTGSYSRSSIIE